MAAPHYGHYRVSGPTWRRVAFLMVFGAPALLITVATDDAMPGPAKVGVMLVGLAAIGAVSGFARFAGTITSPDGVAVRGLLRTRRYAWPDIQDIQIELNPAGSVRDDAPKQIAVLY